MTGASATTAPAPTSPAAAPAPAAPAPAAPAPAAPAPAAPAPGALLSIGAAAQSLGISERALRYYQQLGLVSPCGRTPGGMRRYSAEDLARVARIRELQTLLGLNLDEIAVVLRNDDRLLEIKRTYRDERTPEEDRARLARECLVLLEGMRATVEAKRQALDKFLADLEQRLARVREVTARTEGPSRPG